MTLEELFRNEIVRKRKERSETQAMVAEAIDVSVRWFQSIEAGRMPGARTALRIIAHLEIDGKDLKSKSSTPL